MDSDLVLYVGRATNMRNRLYKHRSAKSSSVANEFPDYIDWVMTQLEECDETNQREREQYWMNKLNPLYNKINSKCPMTHIEHVKFNQKQKANRLAFLEEEVVRLKELLKSHNISYD
jgi:excinuclease UvrABC nuclease subunit